MGIRSEVKNTRLPDDVEEAYLHAKAMAKIEKETTASTFWATIVNDLAQRLGAVQQGEPIF